MADGRATIKDVYELVDKKQDENNVKIESLRKEMNVRLDTLTDKIDAYALTAALKIELASTNKRIEKLENFKWYLMGIAAAFVLMVNIFADQIKHLFGFH